jgi:hypothetical protein
MLQSTSYLFISAESSLISYKRGVNVKCKFSHSPRRTVLSPSTLGYEKLAEFTKKKNNLFVHVQKEV